MKTLQTVNDGCLFGVDDEDYERCAQFKWHYHRKSGYITRNDGTLLKLHTFVMGRPPLGLVTDHINQNKFDNTKANLRFVPHRTNSENHPCLFDQDHHIYYRVKNRKYLVKFRRNGEIHEKYGFDNIIDARIYRDAWLKAIEEGRLP